MTMTRMIFQDLAVTLHGEDPRENLTSEVEWDYNQHSAWDRGRYDEWRTVCLAIASLCEISANHDVNGNSLFNRDKFLAVCDGRQ